ncbi:hypothetical protein [Tropicibacter alexandrii]|uniref:hypothetical protein n=1 Tax=Tropicibacter alexandrii TaxID=2267683 RepID=UPI000EF45350|nr:hypothetical protein [Tropicibacter alexandrii]
MADNIKSRPLSEREKIAEEQTEKFEQKDQVGRKKHPETHEDISEGMPEADQENLKDVTKTE